MGKLSTNLASFYTLNKPSFAGDVNRARNEYFFSDSADDFEEIRTIDISFVRVADKQSHLKYSH